MLQKFRPDWGFFFPLVAHAGLHAYFTFGIALLYFAQTGQGLQYFYCIMLGLFDFVVHFTMDRIKAGPKYLGRYKTITPQEFKASMAYLSWEGHEREKKEARKKLKENKLFWWSLGLDQMVHHLTHYCIIWWIVA